jgi:GAF domain-containing protein
MTDETAGAPAREAPGDPLSAELLQSVVDVARAIFGAAASSVFLLDEDSRELIFQAVSGQGEGRLVGRALPASSGIAGWVVMSGEPLVVNDLSRSAAFDREFAASTSYVPDSLMAAPLIHDGRVLGVLEVLDPVPQSRTSLGELDLLALFARQAAVALRVVAGRRERPATGLELGNGGRAAALRLMDSLRDLLAPPPGQLEPEK